MSIGLADLEARESMVDHMIQVCTQQLQALTEDSGMARYPFTFDQELI